MKVLINRAALVEALALLSGVVVTRTPKPVLSCVRLTAAKENGAQTLTLTATDMELGLEVTLPQVDITEPGVVLIPAGKLSEIVNNSPDDTLTLETKASDTVTIKGADSFFRVFGYDPGEFPPLDLGSNMPGVKINAGTMKNLLSQSAFAAAKEMTRYAINGVLFERRGKKLCLVATDGHRLAHVKASLDEGGADFSSVVPIKAVALLVRLLADAEQELTFCTEKNHLFISITGAAGVTARMSSALVEGTFPPYQEVIPKDSDKHVTLERERFLSAIRRAALLTNEESKGVRLAFSSGQLSISSRAAGMGEAKIDVKVEYAGDPVEIGFNPVYLMDALKVAGTESVTLDLKTGNKPGLLKAGADFQYVCMPVNLS